MTYVTDTHPLVWLLANSSRLSPTARGLYHDPNVRIVIPTIVLVEIRFLYSRGRITVDLPTALAQISNAGNCLIHSLDERVVDLLPTSLDIHDAIIVGTALIYRDLLGEATALITRDAEITSSGLISVVW
jgi:PIN domain nuclease of toxin-antitoxin system